AASGPHRERAQVIYGIHLLSVAESDDPRAEVEAASEDPDRHRRGERPDWHRGTFVAPAVRPFVLPGVHLFSQLLPRRIVPDVVASSVRRQLVGGNAAADRTPGVVVAGDVRDVYPGLHPGPDEGDGGWQDAAD